MAAELYNSTIADLSRLMAKGEVSSAELMASVIARTKAVDPRVHAFNSFDEEDAMAQARASDERRAAARASGATAPGRSRGSR